MTAYFYKIKHKQTGKYYVGSQYGKNSDPINLLKKYKTSSKYIKKLMEQYGEDCFNIVKIIVRSDAREYEAKYLKKAYNILGRKRFLEIMINRNLAPGILLSKETIAKANEKRKISNSLSQKRLLQQGRHNFQIKPAQRTENWRKKISERMKGNNYGSFRKMDVSLKEKLANASKGNTNVRGTKWWYNSELNIKKRASECPGNGWINKFPIIISKESVEKIRKANSKPKSEEHRRKLSENAKKRYSEGNHNFLKKEKHEEKT